MTNQNENENADAAPEPTIEPIYEGGTGLSIDDLPRNDADPEPAADQAAESEKERAPGKAGKPAGYDQIDFETATPAELKDRFGRIYGQMKRQDALNDQLLRDQRTLHDKLNNYEVAQTSTNVAAHMEQLQSQLQEAIEDGDSAKHASVVRQITQLEVGAAAPGENYKQPAAAPAPAENPDLKEIGTWSEARDWTKPGHKDRHWAAFQVNDIYGDPEWQGSTTAEKLAEVDRRYTEVSKPAPSDTTRQAAAAVLDQAGNTPARRGPADKTKDLGASQKAVALRLFPDKDKEEAYKLYAKGLM